MAARMYECLFLLDSNKAASDWDGISGEVNGVLERHGGQIIDSRPWGEPKLAYPIRRSRKGSYLLTYFDSEPAGIPAMEKDLRLHTGILRFLIVKLPTQIAKEVAAHLRGEVPQTRPVEEPQTAET